MAQFIVLMRRLSADPLAVLRKLIVCSCAFALIAAGAALPSL